MPTFPPTHQTRAAACRPCSSARWPAWRPYRWGGTGTNGFDCSGLVGYVFKTALGVELPRVSRHGNTGQRIDCASLSAGDIVFFGVHGRRVDHVGIYVGNGQFLHAPRTART